MMKTHSKTYYFFRQHKYDLYTAITGIVLAIITIRLASNIKQALFGVLMVSVLTFIGVVTIRSRDRDFYRLPLSKPEEKHDWLGRGTFEYDRNQEAFRITKAGLGYIYSNCLGWSNYSVSFDFKIITKCLGVLIRALNVSDYVMLQIDKKGINPHIRVNGGWKIWKAAEAHLLFDEDLGFGEWQKCEMTCEKDDINIRLKNSDGKRFFEGNWSIPNGQIINFRLEAEKKETSVTVPFPIDLLYGSFGFRNSGNGEDAYVRNVVVEKRG